MSRSDSPRTQAEMTSASRALVRVTPRPNSCEQNRSSVSLSLGRLQLDRPHRRLHRHGRSASRCDEPAGGVLVSTLIACSTQEGVDLGLDRLLHQEADA